MIKTNLFIRLRFVLIFIIINVLAASLLYFFLPRAYQSNVEVNLIENNEYCLAFELQDCGDHIVSLVRNEVLRLSTMPVSNLNITPPNSISQFVLRGLYPEKTLYDFNEVVHFEFGPHGLTVVALGPTAAVALRNSEVIVSSIISAVEQQITSTAQHEIISLNRQIDALSVNLGSPDTPNAQINFPDREFIQAQLTSRKERIQTVLNSANDLLLPRPVLLTKRISLSFAQYFVIVCSFSCICVLLAAGMKLRGHYRLFDLRNVQKLLHNWSITYVSASDLGFKLAIERPSEVIVTVPQFGLRPDFLHPQSAFVFNAIGNLYQLDDFSVDKRLEDAKSDHGSKISSGIASSEYTVRNQEQCISEQSMIIIFAGWYSYSGIRKVLELVRSPAASSVVVFVSLDLLQ